MIAVDTHSHFYPCYDKVAALDSALTNLSTDPRSAVGIKCLALCERFDCDFFGEARASKTIGPFSVEILGEPISLLLKKGNDLLYLFSGRQFASSERIEVLGLVTDLRLPDGLPASEIIERIIIAKGVPVLCWSPGKWTFRRAKVVESMLNRFKPGELFLGDTTLRPSFALTPGTFRKFKEHRILAGSDPLPLSGEERMLGRYFSLLESPFDTERPGESVRAALHRQGEHLGSRCSWAEVISRLGRLYCLRSIKRLT